MPKIYDYVFVFDDLSLSQYPSGGANIIYHLASYLASNGNKVAIVSLTSKLISSLVYFNNFTLKAFMRLRGSDYNYSLLKNVDIITKKGVEDCKRVFACDWQSSQTIVEDLQNHDNKNIKAYRIIQNFEDSYLFSENQVEQAKKAYSYKSLQKIVISEALEQEYIKDNPLRFQDAIDLEIFKPLPIEDKILLHRKMSSHVTVLFPLRKEKSKGSSDVIEAIRILGHKFRDVVYLGYGNLTKDGIPELENFQYYYKPSNKQLVELYRESDIFICPSLIEGMGLNTLEAMASGCAVVTTDNKGINEFARNRENCLIVPIENYKAIQEACEILIADGQLRYNLAKNAYGVVQKYSYGNMYASWDKLNL